MIVKVTRGAKMAGLLTYLQGPGRANEHSDPHLVAGDAAIMAWHDDNELSRIDALDIAKQIDSPRKVYGTEVRVPNYLRNDDGAERRDSRGKKIKDPAAPTRDGNVWHCSLSLHAREGELTDQVWGQIAQDFMDEMGFTDAGGRSPARWVAVRHGVSANGNDHVHIAASCVREDGTKVNTYLDFSRAQKAANMLEHKYRLEVLESRETGLGERGYHQAEKTRAERSGRPELDRDSLARRVRACATASKSEAEFVRRLRGGGLLVRPRMASGRDDVVVGYQVAVRPAKGVDVTPRDAKPIFYGGGKLAKDLTLPRLREEWDDTPTSASEAVAEWRAARRGQPVVGSGRETHRLDPRLYERAARDIEQWNKYLATIPVSDRAQWARAAGRTAGVFAAWSVRVETTTPGPLARASAQLARSAQLPSLQRWPKKAGAVSAGGVALILMQATSTLDKGAAYTLLMRQLAKTVEAIAAAHRAAGDAQRAAQLEGVALTHLADVASRPISVAATSGVPVETARAVRAVESDFPVAAADAVRRPGPPLPPKLEPQRERVQPGREDGLQR